MPPSESADIETAISRSTSSVSTHNAFSSKSTHRGQTLEWSNICVTIKRRKTDDRSILDKVWGQARPGETTAILGPSGAGKTTLFRVLAGRIRNSKNVKVSGSVKIQGVPTDTSKKKIRQLFAYVAQRDSLHSASTVKESLLFSAKLRLPKREHFYDKLVTKLMEELGLTQCGDSLISELSGGERRRTSIGVELISNPSIIFLDEPTSGLDASSAKQVLMLLERVAKADNTVLFTIHQPSSQVFRSFDRLFLLNQGRLMYSGLCDEVKGDFASLQYSVPENYNPADWLLDVAQGESIKKLESNGFFPTEPDQQYVETTQLTFHPHPHGERAFFVTQLKMLLEREKNSIIRNPGAMIANVCITGCFALLSSIIFFGVGKKDRTYMLITQAQLGALVNTLMTVMMGQSQSALMIFTRERPLFLREYSTDHYKILPYFLSKLAAEATQAFAAILVLDLISYFMIGFQMNFFIFFILCYTLALTTTAVCVWLGSMFSDPSMPHALFPLVIVPQFYFSGVFIATNLIPTWVRWIQYLCSLKYATGLGLMYEFADCGPLEIEKKNCEQILRQNNVDVDDKWWYWLAMVGIFLVFRIMAIFVLRKKGGDFS